MRADFTRGLFKDAVVRPMSEGYASQEHSPLYHGVNGEVPAALGVRSAQRGDAVEDVSRDVYTVELLYSCIAIQAV